MDLHSQLERLRLVLDKESLRRLLPTHLCSSVGGMYLDKEPVLPSRQTTHQEQALAVLA